MYVVPEVDEPTRRERDGYRWVALSNTTLGVFMASLDASIVLIALPAIFRGIHLDPLQPANISYLLWMLTGYLFVTAVLVVTFGRLGDMYGRVRMYNAGFAVFSAASLALSLCPWTGGHGAMWLIGWRVVQGVGGALLMANSAAILTDAFEPARRGFAIGVNVIAGMAGSFIGLVLGGIVADIDWRAVFWMNVSMGGGLVYIAAWSLVEFTHFFREARTPYEHAFTGVAVVLYTLSCVAGTLTIAEAVGHQRGWDLTVIAQTNAPLTVE